VITGRPGQPATSSGQAADSEGSASAGESFRPSCLRCRRPLEHCLCPSLPAMATRCRVVLLMHPHEFKKRKSNTGILTCLHLANSEYIFAMDMDNHPRVRSLIDDPANYCLVLYPGPAAIDISATDFTASQLPGFNPERRLVLFLVDATWSLAHKLLRDNPRLKELTQLRLTPLEPSRYRIKRQPKPFCLSTLETVHEILLAFERAGLDSYPDKQRLLASFHAMQDLQIRAAAVCRNPRRNSRSPAGLKAATGLPADATREG